MKRNNFSSGTPWDPVVGYSMAVRIGSQVWVYGTTATNDVGKIVGAGDAYAQILQVLKKLESAFKKAAPS